MDFESSTPRNSRQCGIGRRTTNDMKEPILMNPLRKSRKNINNNPQQTVLNKWIGWAKLWDAIPTSRKIQYEDHHSFFASGDPPDFSRTFRVSVNDLIRKFWQHSCRWDVANEIWLKLNPFVRDGNKHFTSSARRHPEHFDVRSSNKLFSRLYPCAPFKLEILPP